MKFLQVLFLLAVVAFSAFAQADGSLVKLKGNFDFDNPAEQIIAHRFLDGGARLWLLGASTIQIWDVPNAKVISSQRHGINGLSRYTFGGLSLDGQKLLVLSETTYDQSLVPDPVIASQPKIPDHLIPTDKPDKFIRKAAVWDLNSVKRLLLIDKAVYSGYWSKDGRVLVTADFAEFPYPMFPKKKEASFSFYDNGDLKLLSTINIKDLSWTHLSPDGALFYTASLTDKKSFLGVPYPNGMTRVVSIWNTRTGQNEKDLSVGGEDYATLTWKLMPSPSGRYLAMVSKHKSKDAEHKILFWEMNGSGAPKYTIKASPRIRDSFIRFSPDEKLFALDAGKNIQIYEAGTGQKKAEVLDSSLPDHWLADNQILINTYLGRMRVYNVATGNMLYQNPLYYDSYENITSTSTDANGNTTTTSETVITDQTVVVPHPDGKVYLTYSDQYVKLFKVQTGELIETIVHPPFTVIKQKRTIREKDYVKKAGCTDDGKMLYVINAEGTLMTLWDLNDRPLDKTSASAAN